MKGKNVVVNARIPREMKEALRKVVEKDSYINQSDFIREAIDKNLKLLHTCLK